MMKMYLYFGFLYHSLAFEGFFFWKFHFWHLRLIGLSLSKDLYLVITQKLIYIEIRRISHELWQISWNMANFTKSNNSRKTVQSYGVQWEGYVSGFHMKSAGFHVKFTRFHEIHNERPTIARNGKAYVFLDLPGGKGLETLLKVILKLHSCW